MTLLSGLLVLVLALVISGVSGYFSVVGLAHLFAGAFWPVVIMGSALEAGKLVAAGWLHANWGNKRASKLLKGYLTLAVAVLMAITALGIFGFLSKGHLEQEAPLAGIELKISQTEDRIRQITAERARFETRQAGLDQAVAALLTNAKTAKETQAADRARVAQAKDRREIAKEIAVRDAEINKLNDSLVPLRMSVSDVSAKLGPVKYVAQLFGWTDPNTAVQMVILMIMFAFDPLAVVLVLAGTLTIGGWLDERRARKARAEVKEVADAFTLPEGFPASPEEGQIHVRNDFDPPVRFVFEFGRWRLHAEQLVDIVDTFSRDGRGSKVETLPKAEDLPDLDYFKDKLAVGMKVPESYLALADAQGPRDHELATAAEKLAAAHETISDLNLEIEEANDTLRDQRDTLMATRKQASEDELRYMQAMAEAAVENMDLVEKLAIANAALQAASQGAPGTNEHLAQLLAQEQAQTAFLETRIRDLEAKGSPTYVPAVYGTVIPRGKGPVTPTASFDQNVWRAALAGTQGGGGHPVMLRSLPKFGEIEGNNNLTSAGYSPNTIALSASYDDFHRSMLTPPDK